MANVPASMPTTHTEKDDNGVGNEKPLPSFNPYVSSSFAHSRVVPFRKPCSQPRLIHSVSKSPCNTLRLHLPISSSLIHLPLPLISTTPHPRSLASSRTSLSSQPPNHSHRRRIPQNHKKKENRTAYHWPYIPTTRQECVSLPSSINFASASLRLSFKKTEKELTEIPRREFLLNRHLDCILSPSLLLCIHGVTVVDSVEFLRIGSVVRRSLWSKPGRVEGSFCWLADAASILFFLMRIVGVGDDEGDEVF